MCKSNYISQRAPPPRLVSMTCFGIVPPAVTACGAVWGNIAGGGPVHTIISQSTHYRSISHILCTSRTCHLTLSASFWTLKPNTSLARGSTPTMTHLSEMHQTLQLPNFEVHSNVCNMGLVAFSCKHREEGTLQPTCKPPSHQNMSYFTTIHHEYTYSYSVSTP